MSLQQIADICTRHTLLTPTEAQQALAEYASKVKTEEGAPTGPEGLLAFAGRFLVFDVETGVTPNRHDQLIVEFAQASAGLFRPEAALERYLEPDEKPKSEGGRWVEIGKGSYTVQFIHQGKLYRFAPNDLGDWYDVEAVIKAIHRALEDAGIAERFVALESGGQDAGFVFGKPNAIEGAARELGLRLGSDLDGARKSGKAYEEQVLKELQR